VSSPKIYLDSRGIVASASICWGGDEVLSHSRIFLMSRVVGHCRKCVYVCKMATQA
jgi:hypothetical protein